MGAGCGAGGEFKPGCGTGVESAARALARIGTGPYRYTYQKYCDCHPDTPPQTVVTVENLVITRVFHLYSNSDREVPARIGSLDLYWTIEDLFELIGSASEQRAVTRVSYHEDLGYPTRIYIDYDADLVGDELDLQLTMLELLD